MQKPARIAINKSHRRWGYFFYSPCSCYFIFLLFPKLVISELAERTVKVGLQPTALNGVY